MPNAIEIEVNGKRYPLITTRRLRCLRFARRTWSYWQQIRMWRRAVRFVHSAIRRTAPPFLPNSR